MRVALLVIPLLVLAFAPLASAAPDVAVCAGSVGVQPCPGLACVWTAAKATCVPAPSPDASVPTSICKGQRVGFEGYEEWCVNPTDPSCLIEENVWTGADGFSYCTGV